MLNIKILVATHKQYNMPEESMYVPIHVGREGKQDLGYMGDNTGLNISEKNPNYCELTALYWAWKNLDTEYIGLSHYRRYFTTDEKLKQKPANKMDLIVNQQEVESILQQYDIILPNKRNYLIESVRKHYEHTQHIKDLNETEQIIKEKFPEYLPSFNKVMDGKKVHLYNMFVMKKDVFDSYCEWLFDILFELEKRIDISDYTLFHARVYGFISELLLDVWLMDKQYSVKELPVVNLDGINWPKKISKFLIGKFTGYKFTNI